MDDGKAPASLFQQCIHFVAENIDIVESFIGFPSQVGEQIFKLCLEKKKFMTKHLPALSLFTSQFGSDLLDTLNLSGKYLCLNYFIDSLVLFTALRELDVSDCGIGDSHEILANFAKLGRLEALNLSNNCISDVGIQKMTMPYRLLKRGPQNLKYLSLTGNSEVSVKCLKYLSPFRNLSVALSGNIPEKEADYMNWAFTKKKLHHPKVIITHGWASCLIEDWITFVETRKPAVTSRTSTFYTKPKCSQDFMSGQKKSVCLDCIIAQNKTTEKSGKSQKLPRSPKQDSNEDGDRLMALYKQTGPNSTDHYSPSFSVFDNLENTNPYPIKQLLCQQSKFRLKSSECQINKEKYSNTENNKERCSIVSKNINFKTKSTKEDYKTLPTCPTLVKTFLNIEKESKTDSDSDLNLGNSGQQNRLSKICTLNKKRKRIQIHRPDQVDHKVKYPRLESDCHTDKTTVAKQKSSFLECLDSFI